MGLEELFGLIVAIIIVIVFFFMVLPLMASTLGQSSGYIFLIGGFLLVVFVIAIIAMISKAFSGGSGR
jgi:hypothetical protein